MFTRFCLWLFTPTPRNRRAKPGSTAELVVFALFIAALVSCGG